MHSHLEENEGRRGKGARGEGQVNAIATLRRRKKGEGGWGEKTLPYVLSQN